MITIIQNGGANIASIEFALKRLNVESKLTNDADIIKQSSHVILPGVGSAYYAMAQLKEHGLIDVLKSLTQPVLGICLGMQLLYEYSEEGEVSCLGIISGKVKKIKNNLIVPHMGWNTIKRIKNNVLMNEVPNDSYVYFVHSYIAPINDKTLATTDYGTSFAAIVQHNHFFGTQFHPERSSLVGAQILKNFLEL